MNGRTDILVKEAREVLEWDILKFWAGMQDPRGGFYGSIAPDLTADKEAVREEQLNARILWAYSNAYRRFRKREYLMPAMNASSGWSARSDAPGRAAEQPSGALRMSASVAQSLNHVFDPMPTIVGSLPHSTKNHGCSRIKSFKSEPVSLSTPNF